MQLKFIRNLVQFAMNELAGYSRCNSKNMYVLGVLLADVSPAFVCAPWPKNMYKYENPDRRPVPSSNSCAPE